MSQENEDLAQQAVAAVNETYRTGDLLSWRRYVEEACDPDIVLQGGDAFTEGDWRGTEGAVAFVANQMEVLEGMWLRVDEYLYADPEWMVLAITFGGRGRHTGIEVELRPFHVFRFRDGKAIRWQIFLDREQALEAVGLSE
jgi:ketosteroid isomerase-like protein